MLCAVPKALNLFPPRALLHFILDRNELKCIKKNIIHYLIFWDMNKQSSLVQNGSGSNGTLQDNMFGQKDMLAGFHAVTFYLSI